MSAAAQFSRSQRTISYVTWKSLTIKALYLPACVVLGAFAFAFNWATGHRGVFLLDQSMIFDGGWRILQGQTPYKDFLMSFGPVTFCIQALFFRLFGVNWTATVIPASVINFAATLSVIRIVRLLGGGGRLLALCAGLATAICFQAPFGTLWLEQTAMFFDLLALQAVVESLRAPANRRGLWQLGAGFSLAVAILSKQNFGIFFVPVVFAVAATNELPNARRACRSLLFAGTGIAATIGIFLCWVWVFSDFPSFVQRVIVVAGALGRTRMTRSVMASALVFSGAPFNWPPKRAQVQLISVFGGAIALSFAWFNLRAEGSKGKMWREMAPASTVACLLPWFQSFTQATTFNEWQNNFAFLGLTTCLGVSLLIRLIGCIKVAPVTTLNDSLLLPSARSMKLFVLVAAGIWGAVSLQYIGEAAWSRTVQEFEDGATFRNPVQVRGMERVRWGEPTRLGWGEPTQPGENRTLRKSDFEGVVSYLAARKGNFFVMGDSTLFYGLLGVPSPQPLLFFQPLHSFRPNEIPGLDGLIADSLERSNISFVVREKVTYLPENGKSYSGFPRLWAWFTSRFEHISDFGNYEIWERKPDSLP